MAGRKNDITCVCYMIMPDGRTIPFEELTAEERAEWKKRVLQRLSDGMSAYYTQNPEEYALV